MTVTVQDRPVGQRDGPRSVGHRDGRLGGRDVVGMARKDALELRDWVHLDAQTARCVRVELALLDLDVEASEEAEGILEDVPAVDYANAASRSLGVVAQVSKDLRAEASLAAPGQSGDLGTVVRDGGGVGHVDPQGEEDLAHAGDADSVRSLDREERVASGDEACSSEVRGATLGRQDPVPDAEPFGTPVPAGDSDLGGRKGNPVAASTSLGGLGLGGDSFTTYSEREMVKGLMNCVSEKRRRE